MTADLEGADNSMPQLSSGNLIKELLIGFGALVLGIFGIGWAWFAAVFGLAALARELGLSNHAIHRLTGGIVYPDDIMVVAMMLPVIVVSIVVTRRAIRLLKNLDGRWSLIPLFACAVLLFFSIWKGSNPVSRRYDWSVEDNSPFACAGFSGCQDATSYGWPVPVYEVIARADGPYGVSQFSFSGLFANIILLFWVFWALTLIVGGARRLFEYFSSTDSLVSLK